LNKDIELAIDNLRRLAGKYSRAERYYRGDHDLSFATEKFQNAFGSLFREFAMNLCPAIVDAVKDKLHVTGWTLAAGIVVSILRRKTIRQYPYPWMNLWIQIYGCYK
jgi:hypothetical protein